MTPPNIRDATRDDAATVLMLWREFKAEEQEPTWRDDATRDHPRELELAIGTDTVLLAEQGEQPVGLVVADAKGECVGYLHILYVRPSARWSGVAAALVREVVNRLDADGRAVLELDVLASNESARSVYERWGFTPVELTLAATVDTLVDRLGGPTPRR